MRCEGRLVPIGRFSSRRHLSRRRGTFDVPNAEFPEAPDYTFLKQYCPSTDSPAQECRRACVSLDPCRRARPDLTPRRESTSADHYVWPTSPPPFGSHEGQSSSMKRMG